MKRKPLAVRIGSYLLGLCLATWIVSIPVGILGASNLVWGEDNQYGRVPIPATRTLHFPAGEVDVALAVAIPGRGNATPDVHVPDDLVLTVVPADGGADPIVTDNVGSSENANDDQVDTQRQIWQMQVGRAGDYRVSARGSFAGYGLSPQLWFGHGPPLHGPVIWLVAAGIVVVASGVWFLFRRGRRRGTSPG